MNGCDQRQYKFNGFDFQIKSPVKIVLSKSELLKTGPIIIGGTGGSGTRMLAKIHRQAGVYIGTNLNESSDALDIIGFHNGLYWLGDLFQSWNSDLTDEDYKLIINRFIKCLEIHLRGFKAKSSNKLWGWKSPPSIFLIPFFHRHFSHLKCVHLVRDGRDIACSRNQNQLRYLAPWVLTIEENNLEQKLKSIVLWNKMNLITADYGEKYLSDRYLRVRYEDLCYHPAKTVQTILDFLELKASAETIAKTQISNPKTINRWKSLNSEVADKLNQLGKPGLERFDYL
jgi:hypothetical protein